MKIVITGKLRFGTREDFVNHINSFKLFVSMPKVSHDIHFLVTNETTSTSKYKDAKRYDVGIISEDDFLDLYVY